MSQGPGSTRQNNGPFVVGGFYNLAPFALVDGQACSLQFDVNGNLKVTSIGGGGGGGNAAAGPTGAPVPADADYLGVNIGGTLFGVTGFNLTDSTPIAVAIVNANGDQITSFGGGVQYATGTAVPTPTGTAALGWDGTDVRVLSTDATGQLKVLIENTPAVTVSGSVSVTQGTSPWVVSLTSTTITGNVNVVGTTTDGTTTETNFLVVGGESNDATAQYQPIPLGTTGRSVIIEGVAGGTAVPISGSISFSAPQHVIVDSGTVSVTQGTSPWVVSLTSTTITGTVSVTQGTSPWIVAGAKTPSDTFANPTDAEDAFALLGGWDATNSVWRRVQVDAGTGTLKVDIGSNGTVAITGTVSVTQGTSPWVVSLTSTTITGNVNVVGTTTDGTTTETSFLVVGGESNDATAQYQPIPLGTGGRSVIVEGITGGTVIPISGTVTANQGTPNTLANAWPTEITDGVNGPAAVKSGSAFPSSLDAALVVTLSPNNQDTRGLSDLLQTLILEVRAMRTALVYMITENGDILDSDFNPQSQDFQPVN
jgi:hypothetical protein